MSKTHTIDSDIRTSDTFATLSLLGRDLWHGLIAMADDQGRMRAAAPYVRSQVFPYDDFSIEEVQEQLEILAAGDDPFIKVYAVDGKQYLQIINWWKYQKMQWAGPSKLPAPDGWMDRMRYHGRGNVTITTNWDTPGGFCIENPPKNKPSRLPSDLPSDLPSALSRDDVNDDVKGEGEGNGEGDGDGDGDPSEPAGRSAGCAGDFKKFSRPEQNKAWNIAVGELQRDMSRVDFDNWIRPLRTSGMIGNEFRVMAVNKYARDWVAKRMSQTLERHLSGFLKTEVHLVVTSEGDDEAVADDLDPGTWEQISQVKTVQGV